MATIGEWAKMYGTGNYADTSKRIGTAVEDAIGQNRARMDRMRAEEDRQRKMALENYAMQQMKIKEYTGLVVPQDSRYDSIENHFQEAASYIPDAYAALESSGLSQNEIAMGKAQLLQEVGSLKASRQTIINQANAYQQAVNDGTISGANSADTLDYYNTLITPNNGVRVGMEGNSMILQGKTVTENKDISIPLNKYDQSSPRLLLKGPDPRKNLKTLNKEGYDRGLWTTADNPDLIEAYKDSFTSLADGAGNDGIKALAVDWFGMSNEQVDRLANTTNDDNAGYKVGNESYANALEYELEKKYVEMGQSTFINSRKAQLAEENQELILKANRLKLQGAVNKGNPNEVKQIQENQRLATAFENVTENLGDLGLSQNDKGVFSGELQLTDPNDNTKLNPQLKQALGKMGLETEEFGAEAIINEDTGEVTQPGTTDYIKISMPGNDGKKSITLNPGENAQAALQKIFIAQGFSETQAKDLAAGFIPGQYSEDGTTYTQRGNTMQFNQIRSAQIANPGVRQQFNYN